MKSIIWLRWRWIYLSFCVVSVHSSFAMRKETSAISELTRKCATNPTEPSTVFTTSNPCDPASNCRYGGICRTTFNITNSGQRIQHARVAHETCLCTLNCRDSHHPARTRSIPVEQSYVCGTDGWTYDSECNLRLAACRCQYPISIKWRGACERGPISPSTQTLADTDVISSGFDGSGSGDGNTCGGGITCNFGAVCDSDAEDGPCLCAMSCQGSQSYTVCGTDGRSYYNECYLKEAACQEQTLIEVDHAGECEHEPSSFDGDIIGSESSGEEDITICSTLNCEGDVIEAVCGSDGVTYPNHCSLRLAACISGNPLHVVYVGHCDEVDIHSIATHEEQPASESPCDDIYCLHGAACLAKGTDDFECSCDVICTKESLMGRQNSLAHLGKVTLNQLAQFLPEFQSLLYDEEQEVFEATERRDPGSNPRSDELPTTNVPERLEPGALSRDDEEEPIIDTLDGAGISPIRFVTKGGQQGYVGDFEYEDNLAMQRRRRGHRRNRGRRSRRQKRSPVIDRIQNYVNETVCGTDGKTYKDECQMRIHACHEKKFIKIKKVGACPYYINRKTKPVKSKPTSATTITSTTTTVTSKTATSTSTITSTGASTTWRATAPPSDKTVNEENEESIDGENLLDSSSKSSLVPDEVARGDVQEIVSTSTVTTHTDSQTKSTAKIPAVTEETQVPEENGITDVFSDISDAASEAHAMEYTWLVAVGVMAQLTLIGLVVGFCYRRAQTRKLAHASDHKACETVVVVTTSGSETKPAETNPDPQLPHV